MGQNSQYNQQYGHHPQQQHMNGPAGMNGPGGHPPMSNGPMGPGPHPMGPQHMGPQGHPGMGPQHMGPQGPMQGPMQGQPGPMTGKPGMYANRRPAPYPNPQTYMQNKRHAFPAQQVSI